MFKDNNKIKGIICRNKEKRPLQFVDDTNGTIIMKGILLTC
jgi:hypothetical protein